MDKLSKEQVDEITNAIKFSVRSYMRETGRYNYDNVEEDIIQDMWVNIFEKSRRDGKIPDIPLIKKMTRDYCVDLTRKATGSKDAGDRIDNYSYSRTSDNEDSDDSYNPALIDHSDNYGLVDTLLDLRRMIPESQIYEHKWLDFWLQAAGIESGEIAEVSDDGYKSGFTDKNCAKYLGLNREGDRFRNLNDKMKQMVATYFGNKNGR